MSEPDFPEPGRPRRGEQMERRLASREIGRAIRVVQSVRVLFITMAVIGAIWTLVTLLADRGPDPVYLALGIAGTVLPLVGIWRVPKEPRLWTILVAVIQTLMAGVLAYQVDFHPIRIFFSLPTLFMVIVAICWWGAVAVIAPVSRMVRENPDLSLARGPKGERYRRAHGERGRAPRRRR